MIFGANRCTRPHAVDGLGFVFHADADQFAHMHVWMDALTQAVWTGLAGLPSTKDRRAPHLTKPFPLPFLHARLWSHPVPDGPGRAADSGGAAELAGGHCVSRGVTVRGGGRVRPGLLRAL
jgi:hypothetical protein